MTCLFGPTLATHAIECGSTSQLKTLRPIRFVDRLFNMMQKQLPGFVVYMWFLSAVYCFQCVDTDCWLGIRKSIWCVKIE